MVPPARCDEAELANLLPGLLGPELFFVHSFLPQNDQARQTNRVRGNKQPSKLLARGRHTMHDEEYSCIACVRLRVRKQGFCTIGQKGARTWVTLGTLEAFLAGTPSTFSGHAFRARTRGTNSGHGLWARTRVTLSGHALWARTSGTLGAHTRQQGRLDPRTPPISQIFAQLRALTSGVVVKMRAPSTCPECMP